MVIAILIIPLTLAAETEFQFRIRIARPAAYGAFVLGDTVSLGLFYSMTVLHTALDLCRVKLYPAPGSYEEYDEIEK